jgi:hypothetical protein
MSEIIIYVSSYVEMPMNVSDNETYDRNFQFKIPKGLRFFFTSNPTPLSKPCNIYDSKLRKDLLEHGIADIYREPKRSDRRHDYYNNIGIYESKDKCVNLQLSFLVGYSKIEKFNIYIIEPLKNSIQPFESPHFPFKKHHMYDGRPMFSSLINPQYNYSYLTLKNLLGIVYAYGVDRFGKKFWKKNKINIVLHSCWQSNPVWWIKSNILQKMEKKSKKIFKKSKKRMSKKIIKSSEKPPDRWPKYPILYMRSDGFGGIR